MLILEKKKLNIIKTYVLNISIFYGFQAIRSFCDDPTSLPYDYLVDLVEHLKACLEVASVRTGNWQKYCIANDGVVPFLMQASCLLDEGHKHFFKINKIIIFLVL